MEADWEVEVGGDAPVIDALWAGFIDLLRSPERIGEIAESAKFPALAKLLLSLNGAEGPLWTAKCDLWEPKPNELVCYVDLLPRAGLVFSQWEEAEAFCRSWVARLDCAPLPAFDSNARVDLVVRDAVAGEVQGFGITAYLSADASASGPDRSLADAALTELLDFFFATIPPLATPGTPQ
jgi:hypothetical protein